MLRLRRVESLVLKSLEMASFVSPADRTVIGDWIERRLEAHCNCQFTVKLSAHRSEAETKQFQNCFETVLF